MDSLKNALDISVDELESYKGKLEHSDASGIKKLWQEVCSVLNIDESNEEWYLKFHQLFSRILKEAYRDFSSKL